MAYIYYIWKDEHDGYIGQDSGPTAKYNRLWEHIEGAYLGTRPNYGSEQLIARYSCSQVIFGVLEQHSVPGKIYGIPESVFNQFVERWTDKGTTLSERDILNVAETLHIVGRKVNGQDLSGANISIGGTYLKGDTKFTYHLTAEENKALNDLIGVLENDDDITGFNAEAFRKRFTQITLSGFNKLEHWDKVVYPAVYRAMEDISKLITIGVHNKILNLVLKEIVEGDMIAEIAADTLNPLDTKNRLTEYANRIYLNVSNDKELKQVKNKLQYYIEKVGEIFGVAMIKFDEGENMRVLDATCTDIVYNVVSAFRTRFRVDAVAKYIQNHFDELTKNNASVLFQRFVKSAGGDFLPSSDKLTMQVAPGKNLFNVRMIDEKASLPNWMEELKKGFSGPIRKLVTNNTTVDGDLRKVIKQFSFKCFKTWYDDTTKINPTSVFSGNEGSEETDEDASVTRTMGTLTITKLSGTPNYFITSCDEKDTLLARVREKAQEVLGRNSFLIKYWRPYYRGCMTKLTRESHTLSIGTNSAAGDLENLGVKGYTSNTTWLTVDHGNAVLNYPVFPNINCESDHIY